MEKRIRQNKKTGAVSNCHCGQVVKAKCLKSKWDRSLPVAGALLALSSGEEKDLAE